MINKKTISLFLLLVVLSKGFGASAQGDLLVYPKILVFSGTQERVKILNFKNQGQDSATYKLSYIQNRMTEKGSLKIIETPDEGQLFASPYLRFYPRSVTLAPGETQTVKVQLSRINNLESGEYRSHLYIRAEGRAVALEKKSPLERPEGISIQLKPIYGLSIPNIIRIGDTKVESALQNISLSYVEDNPVLSVRLIRDGNKSVKGNIEVELINHQGKKTTIGKKTVVIYSPTEFQNITIELKVPQGIKLDNGRLQITFTDYEGKKELLATENLDL